MSEGVNPQGEETNERQQAAEPEAGSERGAGTASAAGQREGEVKSETGQQPAPETAQEEETGQPGPQEFSRLLSESEKQSREATVGEKLSGVLVKIESESSFVDFGGRSEAVIRTSELQNEQGEMVYAVGDPLEAFVASAQDEVLLTRTLTQEDRQADLLYQAFKAGIPVEGRVDAVNKWGLGITIQGEVRAFCPISQVDTQFVENAEEYRGKTMTFKISEFRNQGRNIVVSRRALLEKEKDQEEQKVRDVLKKDTEVEGKVTRLEDFGAFVDLGAGVEGLIHVSELSHQRVGHPQEVLKVGEVVKVRVLRTKSLGSRRKERISLSLKALEKDPWEQLRDQYPAGSLVDGKVDALEDFGAFVEISPGVRGLLHVSEIANRRIGHPREELELGQQIKVVILEVDSRRRRLRLSMKQVESMEADIEMKHFQEHQQKEKEEDAGDTAMMDALRRAKLIG